MITVIVGHRGVGKTSFLTRIEQYYVEANKPCKMYDLDHEIERKYGRSISEIFDSKGERTFREIEKKVFIELLRIAHADWGDGYISLGAGYQGEIPQGVRVIWLRRKTDRDGRAFLDRPRLDKNLTAFEEYLSRFAERERRYKEMAHEVYIMAEGGHQGDESEKLFLGLKSVRLGGGLTLFQNQFRNVVDFRKFIQKRLSWGVEFFELRDDLVNKDHLHLAKKTIPRKNLLLSFRQKDAAVFAKEKLNEFIWDWPLELGLHPPGSPKILSLHSRNEHMDIKDCCERLNRFQSQFAPKKPHLKLAVPVFSLDELLVGHQWYEQDPEHRSFLPRSQQGRWAWYRAAMRGQMKITFFREGDGSGIDQPTLSEWYHALGGREFAAVLGWPVHHSRTPNEHREFFKQTNQSVFAIPIDENEMSLQSMSILARLGLRYGAVTSPLKTKAFEICAYKDPLAIELKSVNTMAYEPGKKIWLGVNTDLDGLKKLIQSDQNAQGIAVWGGGGTKAAIRAVLPQASFYSARTGELIQGSGGHPDVVIWAVGRSRMGKCKWPSKNWRPRLIIDLNYTDDSPGLEYAIQCEAGYRSGLRMFHVQAQVQQLFFKEFLQATK